MFTCIYYNELGLKEGGQFQNDGSVCSLGAESLRCCIVVAFCAATSLMELNVLCNHGGQLLRVVSVCSSDTVAFS